jgi:putative oxidoreductase
MRSTYHIGLLLLRIGFCGLMLTHGIPKLWEVIQGNFAFGDPIGIGPTLSKIGAVIGEAIAPLLILIGYRTRLFAIPTIITMGVVVFIVLGNDPLGKKELALLYLFAFTVIALTGAGKYSVDRR